ncbi:hypothetical protein [Cyanobium sp. NS01]|uniref:hypothetical protein n=1 Tax=Cyanobium sp. NS01 TaxID=261284 RepID=UPI0016455C17|nr:hypothetical protein [Cyanobium sp. NS01]
MAPGAVPRAIPRSNRGQARGAVRVPQRAAFVRGASEPPPQRRSALGQDFVAMTQVWQMLRSGAVRVWGEIGRKT